MSRSDRSTGMKMKGNLLQELMKLFFLRNIFKQMTLFPRKTGLSVFLTVFLLLTSSLWAADTCKVTIDQTDRQNNTVIYTVTWVDETGDGVSCTISEVHGFLLSAETNPGGTAPTDNYDITLVDEDSADVAMGELANRDTANTEIVDFTAKLKVDGDLVFTITDASQDVAGGQGKMKLWIWEEK